MHEQACIQLASIMWAVINRNLKFTLIPALLGHWAYVRGVLWALTHLAPTGALLEAITNLLRSLSNGQVLLHIAAVPLVAGQLHAQGVILCQGVGGRPPCLLVGV